MPICKVTAKNQLTLPAAVLDQLGRPSHFRVHVAKGMLVLAPAEMVTHDALARQAAIPGAVLREAYALARTPRPEPKPTTGPDKSPIPQACPPRQA